MNQWIAQFMGRWRRFRKDRPRPVVASSSVPVDRSDYLLALDRLRIQNPDAYSTILNWQRSQLLACYQLKLFTNVHPTEFIAHVALAQRTKADTLEGLIIDMEQTVDQLTAPKREEEDLVPSGVLAGS